MFSTRCVALVLVLAGCGHSVLIHKDDQTYRAAIDHYRHTRQLITESLAPDDDQAMFLQAEGFYRYRFAPPGRSAASYLAQGTASIINLPVLDSLASSLDMYSLRVRIDDAAVQIWESLLARNPTTPLRPLTLYRLGWAYRNTLASGFPSSSEMAFDQLIRDGAPLAPLALEARQVPWKSQAKATAWSIVPGLGQMYTGHYASGTIRLAIAAAAAAAVIVPGVLAFERGSDLSFQSDWPLFVSALVGAGVLAIDYSASYQDARKNALELNEQAEAAFEAAHPDAP